MTGEREDWVSLESEWVVIRSFPEYGAITDLSSRRRKDRTRALWGQNTKGKSEVVPAAKKGRVTVK